MTEQTVDTMIDECLAQGLIKNKTEGKKLKKAGLLELLAAHTAKSVAEPETVFVQGEMKPFSEVKKALEALPVSAEPETTHTTTDLLAEDVPAQDWPTRGHVKAMEMPDSTVESVPVVEKDLHHDHEHDSSEHVPSPAADNILRRYGNQYRTSRGGEKRDRVKTKAARRARKIARRNRK